MLPEIVIIGRPNVGKSTLFNRLVGKRLALVDDQPGVTRDRRVGEAELLGLKFSIVDTAGYEDEDPETLPGRMRQQTEAAVAGAAATLFVVDARAGITPLDEEIARWLRTVKTPIVLVANKAEGKAAESGLLESYALGFGDPVALSAEHGEGLADLFGAIREPVEQAMLALEQGSDAAEALQKPELDVVVAEDAPDEEFVPSEEELGALQLAIVGRPNAGKSTLINTMLGEDRLITGPEAGITRDSIAVNWEWTDRDGDVREVRLIDTAGMRKRAKVIEKLEKMSVADARRAIDFAEVVVLLLDATKGLEAQDLKIADHVLQEGRALIVAINKWDVAENASALFNGIRAALDDGLAQIRGVPVITVSAMTGKGIDPLLSAAFEVRRSWSRRIPTSLLNRWFDDALDANPPPAPGGKRIKLRFITQAKTRPPGFVLFGTRLDALPESYKRYLINGIRRDLGFDAVPVRLTLRSPKNPYHTRQKDRD
ncbi:MAG: ribosome biogenesis GTPase Der [Pseudomonadota bacterium]